jgi:DNA-binding transcriptional LysR family regulator
VKEFHRVYPDVKVQVDYRRSSQVYARVLSGEVHFGLVACPARRKGLQVEQFRADKMVVICHPNHPLALKSILAPEDLNGEKFISFDPDLPTRKMIDRILKERGITVNTVAEFDNVETVKRAVEIESGISIVPQSTVKEELEAGDLVSSEIENIEIWRPLGILFRSGHSRSPAERELINLLRSASGRMD